MSMSIEDWVQRALSSPAAAQAINKDHKSLVTQLFMDARVQEKFNTDATWGCALLFGYLAADYQSKILNDDGTRTLELLTRQGGKTTTIGAKVLHRLLTRKRINILVVSPSMRQSLIFRNKMDMHLLAMPTALRRGLFRKIQRTQIFATNGSTAYFLPNSPDKMKGFTANIVVLEEFAIFKDAEVLMDEVVSPMLFTTNGSIWVLTTPRTKTHRCYELSQDKKYHVHHVTWREAVRQGIGFWVPVWEQLRPQLAFKARQEADDKLELHPIELHDKEGGIAFIDGVLKKWGTPMNFRSEFEAEFIDDEDAALPWQWLINCVDVNRTYDYLPFESMQEGVFYGGVDFGKKVNNSVVVVGRIENHNGQRVVNVVHTKVFDLNTPYGVVIAYMRVLNERWHVRQWLCDQTGVGESVMEDVHKVMRNAEGILLSAPKEKEVVQQVRQAYLDLRMRIPYDQWLLQELNRQRVELGKVKGEEHYPKPPQGNDVFWAHNLMVFCAREQRSGVAAV